MQISWNMWGSWKISQFSIFNSYLVLMNVFSLLCHIQTLKWNNWPSKWLLYRIVLKKISSCQVLIRDMVNVLIFTCIVVWIILSKRYFVIFYLKEINVLHKFFDFWTCKRILTSSILQNKNFQVRWKVYWQIDNHQHMSTQIHVVLFHRCAKSYSICGRAAQLQLSCIQFSLC